MSVESDFREAVDAFDADEVDRLLTRHGNALLTKVFWLDGGNALHQAVSVCDTPVVEVLVRHGADVSQLLKKTSPLASLFKILQYVDEDFKGDYISEICAGADFLIAHGAKIETSGQWGDCNADLIKMIARRDKDAAMLARVVQSGADIDEEGPTGETALMQLSKDAGEDLNGLKNLAAVKASLDHQTKVSGATALMLALYRKQFKAAACLLELGCNPAVKDKNGFTAAEIAAMYGHGPAYQALLEAASRKRGEAVSRVIHEGLKNNVVLRPVRLRRPPPPGKN